MSIDLRSKLPDDLQEVAQQTAAEVARDTARGVALITNAVASSIPGPPVESTRVVRYGPVELNTSTYVASVAGQMVSLTKAEFDLLEYLIRHRDRVVAPTEIAREIFANTGLASDHLVRVHIHNLRRAIGSAASIVINVRGRGYRIIS